MLLVHTSDKRGGSTCPTPNVTWRRRCNVAIVYVVKMAMRGSDLVETTSEAVGERGTVVQKETMVAERLDEAGNEHVVDMGGEHDVGEGKGEEATKKESAASTGETVVRAAALSTTDGDVSSSEGGTTQEVNTPQLGEE